MAGSASIKTSRESGPGETFSFHIDNQAQVPIGLLRLAVGKVTSVFRETGIQITWEQSSFVAPECQEGDVGTEASCLSSDKPYCIVRLVRRKPAGFPDTLGFALPFAQTGVQVSIFYDRVEASSWSFSTDQSVILGYTMAHEIGHVLLRSSEHSPSGLMQSRWNQATWHKAAHGWLSFSPEQAERMVTRLQTSRAQHAPKNESTMASFARRHLPE
jgi:hypothetical protein